jgi:hypothetical protein
MSRYVDYSDPAIKAFLRRYPDRPAPPSVLAQRKRGEITEADCVWLCGGEHPDDEKMARDLHAGMKRRQMDWARRNAR